MSCLEPRAQNAGRQIRTAAQHLAVGPDPVVMLSDVAGLSTDEATSVLRWAGIALLRAGLADVEAASAS